MPPGVMKASSLLLQHAVDALVAAQPAILRVIGVDPRLVGDEIDLIGNVEA